MIFPRAGFTDYDQVFYLQSIPEPGTVVLSGAAVDPFSITAATADASVELSGAAAEVTLFRADTDFGTNLIDWQTNGTANALGGQAVGPVQGSLSGLSADTPYTVRFYAVNTVPEPDQEAWSSAVTFSTAFASGQKVTDLAATAVAYDQIDLTWSDAFKTETGYYIERSEDGVIWESVATLPPDTTGHADSGLNELTTYQYRILGANAVSGDSDWSDPAQDTTPAEPPPALPVPVVYSAAAPTTNVEVFYDPAALPTDYTSWAQSVRGISDSNKNENVGQTFTTTTAFTLDRITLLQFNKDSATDQTYFLNIYTVADADSFPTGPGGRTQRISSTLFNGLTQVTAQDMTIDVEDVALAANSTYMYVIGCHTDDGTNWTSFANDGGLDGSPDYAGGALTSAIEPTSKNTTRIDDLPAGAFSGNDQVFYLLNAQTPTNDFAAWIGGFSVGGLTGFNDDFDLDGLGNGLENFLGTNPSVWNAGLTQVSSDGTSVSFQHLQNASPASDVTGDYEWSTDLENWHAPGTVGATTVTITPILNDPVAGTTSVTATASGTIPAQLFVRVKAVQTM